MVLLPRGAVTVLLEVLAWGGVVRMGVNGNLGVEGRRVDLDQMREVGTFEVLHRHREALKPIIRRFEALRCDPERAC